MQVGLAEWSQKISAAFENCRSEKADIESAEKTALDEVLYDPRLTHKQRRKILRFHRKKLSSNIAGYDADLKKLDVEKKHIERIIEIVESVSEWTRKPLILGRAIGSRLDSLREADRTDLLLHIGESKSRDFVRPKLGEILADTHSFCIEHNWAAAFEGAQDFNAPTFRLPYDLCAFEFHLSRLPCIRAMTPNPAL